MNKMKFKGKIQFFAKISIFSRNAPFSLGNDLKFGVSAEKLEIYLDRVLLPFAFVAS